VPVAGARVTIVEKGLDAETDDEGRFKFDRVPRGQYTLRAVSGSKEAARSIELPGDDYDLVFTAGEDTGATGSDRDPPGRQGGPHGGRRR